MAEQYRLRYLGDPILRTPARDVERPEDIPADLIHEMRAVLRQHRGMGLAAQQVGSDLRIALMGSAEHAVVAINLRIVDRSPEMADSVGEGCLSVQRDGRYFRTNVRRHAWVEIEYRDQRWTVQRRRLTGLDAVIAQHECDHLDGRCIVDGLSRQQRRQAERLVGSRRAGAGHA